MERVCEKRQADGFPSLAIQWGAIGEVGAAAEMKDDVGGTQKQSVVSCLKVSMFFCNFVRIMTSLAFCCCILVICFLLMPC